MEAMHIFTVPDELIPKNAGFVGIPAEDRPGEQYVVAPHQTCNGCNECVASCKTHSLTLVDTDADVKARSIETYHALAPMPVWFGEHSEDDMVCVCVTQCM
jgi:ferredoxin